MISIAVLLSIDQYRSICQDHQKVFLLWSLFSNRHHEDDDAAHDDDDDFHDDDDGAHDDHDVPDDDDDFHDDAAHDDDDDDGIRPAAACEAALVSSSRYSKFSGQWTIRMIRTEYKAQPTKL